MNEEIKQTTIKLAHTISMLVLAALLYIGLQAHFAAEFKATYGSSEEAFKAGQQAVAESVIAEFKAQDSITITLEDGKKVVLKPTKE